MQTNFWFSCSNASVYTTLCQNALIVISTNTCKHKNSVTPYQLRSQSVYQGKQSPLSNGANRCCFWGYNQFIRVNCPVVDRCGWKMTSWRRGQKSGWSGRGTLQLTGSQVTRAVSLQRAELGPGLLLLGSGSLLRFSTLSLSKGAVSELFCHCCKIEFWPFQWGEQSVPLCFILKASKIQHCLDCWEVLNTQDWLCAIDKQGCRSKVKSLAVVKKVTKGLAMLDFSTLLRGSRVQTQTILVELWGNKQCLRTLPLGPFVGSDSTCFQRQARHSGGIFLFREYSRSKRSHKAVTWFHKQNSPGRYATYNKRMSPHGTEKLSTTGHLLKFSFVLATEESLAANRFQENRSGIPKSRRSGGEVVSTRCFWER